MEFFCICLPRRAHCYPCVLQRLLDVSASRFERSSNKVKHSRTWHPRTSVMAQSNSIQWGCSDLLKSFCSKFQSCRSLKLITHFHELNPCLQRGAEGEGRPGQEGFVHECNSSCPITMAVKSSIHDAAIDDAWEGLELLGENDLCYEPRLRPVALDAQAILGCWPCDQLGLTASFQEPISLYM